MKGYGMSQGTFFKSAVGNPFTPVPKNKKSHVRGWAKHWADLIETDVMHKDEGFGRLDVLYMDHGVNSTPGQLNLFGGVTDGMAMDLIDIVMNKNLKIISLDAPMPVDEYCDGLKKRLGQNTCSKMLSAGLIESFREKLSAQGSHHLKQEGFVGRSGMIAIGDSHTTSYARSGQPVLRHNGLTLHGALKRRFFQSQVELIAEEASKNRTNYGYRALELVTLVAGSVDIRHHIGRQKDPEDAAEELAFDFIDAANEMRKELDVEVEIGIPVPVEYEGRKVPKTGWYEGAPFTGSRELRHRWTHIMAEVIKEEYDLWVQPPSEWYTMDPEEYAKEHMELSSSVHISPVDYRRHGGWNENS